MGAEMVSSSEIFYADTLHKQRIFYPGDRHGTLCNSLHVHPEDASVVAIWMKRDALCVADIILADVRNTPPQVYVCACSNAWIQRARIASESRERALLVTPKLFNSGEDKEKDKDKPKPKPDGQGGREAQEPQIPKTKKVE